MKHGKKYVDSAKLVDKTKLYENDEAMDLCVKTATAKFDETVEVHVKLGVDSRHADQQVRGAIVLPNGTGKNVKVLAICKGDNVKLAEEAGADYVGAEEMTTRIQNEGWMDFDVLITTPDMMGLVGRLGKVLGPRGLMPNPKAVSFLPLPFLWKFNLYFKTHFKYHEFHKPSKILFALFNCFFLTLRAFCLIIFSLLYKQFLILADIFL